MRDILVVENNDAWRGLINRAVREVFGCGTRICGTVEEAAEAVLASHPVGIITALRMPIAQGMEVEPLGGLKLLKTLRVDPVVARIPIVVLSGKETDDYKESLPDGVPFFDKGKATALDAVQKLFEMVGTR